MLASKGTKSYCCTASRFEMKITPLVIDVEVRMAGNEMAETVVAAKRALRELGVVMPRRVTVVSLLLKLRKVRQLLRGKTDDDILGLPLMRDSTISTAVKVSDSPKLVLFAPG